MRALTVLIIAHLACNSYQHVAVHGDFPKSWPHVDKQTWRFTLAESFDSIEKNRFKLDAENRLAIWEAHQLGEQNSNALGKPTIAGLRQQYRFLLSKGFPPDVIDDLLRSGICGEITENNFIQLMAHGASRKTAFAWADWLEERDLRPKHRLLLRILAAGKIGGRTLHDAAAEEIHKEFDLSENVEIIVRRGMVAEVRLIPEQVSHALIAEVLPLVRRYAHSIKRIRCVEWHRKAQLVLTGIFHGGNQLRRDLAAGDTEADRAIYRSLFVTVRASETPAEPSAMFLREQRYAN